MFKIGVLHGAVNISVNTINPLILNNSSYTYWRMESTPQVTDLESDNYDWYGYHSGCQIGNNKLQPLKTNSQLKAVSFVMIVNVKTSIKIE